MLRLIALLLLVFSSLLLADTRFAIRSAVSPEFPEGLHYKYLRYIAETMDMSLDVVPMSFSRRVRALREGELDLLVGLQGVGEHQQKDIIYIYPHYQELSSAFFVRTNEKHKLNRYQDLTSFNIAVTSKVSYFDDFDHDNALAKVVVDSLQQKVKLLVNGRVDTFIHNRDSTEAILKALGLTGKVALANYQPSDKRQYFFAIGQDSRLLPHLRQLIQVVKQGTENGVFKNIRRQHYQTLVSQSDSPHTDVMGF